MLERSDHEELHPVEIEAASYPSLAGRGVVITGGGSGIGMYLVEAFCAQGAKVGFIDRDAAAASHVVNACTQMTGNAPSFAQADVTDIQALQSAIDALRDAIGPITTLINNAGNDDRKPLTDVTADYWDERMNVNLRHQFFAAQAVLSDMQEVGGGVIIHMGSNSWMQGAPGLIFYTTAKSAIQGLTRCMAREVGEANVRVNSIAPGWVLTERQVSRAKAIYQGKFDDYLERQCLKEFLLPPDVARMALFLAADDSRMITGQTFIVDGGVV